MKSKILDKWIGKLVLVIIDKVEEGHYHVSKLVEYDSEGILLNSDNLPDDIYSLVDSGFYLWKDISRIRKYEV